ncbi:hypothetical protein UFOVP1339_28 [uncultured Caudovirales phage]|uniref:Uncharacterized protein n=1 Tax=uncultured Caudovirales phage TaxID=2100421 RepID=A0A6J5RSH9_9CAUD|nr:hypothetical protein UFOVP1339_28 [uncultured Caudovirales phage]
MQKTTTTALEACTTSFWKLQAALRHGRIEPSFARTKLSLIIAQVPSLRQAAIKALAGLSS